MRRRVSSSFFYGCSYGQLYGSQSRVCNSRLYRFQSVIPQITRTEQQMVHSCQSTHWHIWLRIHLHSLFYSFKFLTADNFTCDLPFGAYCIYQLYMLTRALRLRIKEFGTEIMVTTHAFVCVFSHASAYVFVSFGCGSCQLLSCLHTCHNSWWTSGKMAALMEMNDKLTAWCALNQLITPYGYMKWQTEIPL